MSEATQQLSPQLPLVLLVDDEPLVLKSLLRCLRKLPIDLKTAPSVEQAYVEMAQTIPAVIVSDYMMPGHDGIQFFEALKGEHPTIQRIMLTGAADLDVIQNAVNQGQVHRFLTKPWQDDHLLSTIIQAVEHHQVLEDNLRLNELTLTQNQQLRELNHTLEERVQRRTALLIQQKKIGSRHLMPSANQYP